MTLRLRRAVTAPPLLAFIACALAALALTARGWLDPTHTWPGTVAGDPEKFMNYLAWFQHAIPRGQNPLHDSTADLPQGINLMWDTTMIVPALLVWPVSLLAGPVAAYNAVLTGGLALNGWCSWIWLRRHAGAWPALAGALFVEWGPYIAGHATGHLNLVLIAPIPLLLLCLDELVAVQGMAAPRLGVLIAVCAALEMNGSEEELALFAIGAGVVVVVAALLRPRQVSIRIGYAARAVAVAAACFVIVAGAGLLYQFAGPGAVRTAIHPAGMYVTDLTSIVVPQPAQIWNWGGVSVSQAGLWSGNVFEQTGFIGVPVLLVALATIVVLWSDLRVRVAGISSLIVLLLSLGPHLHVGGHDTGIRLPGVVLSHLPVLNNILPGRLSLMVDLGLAFVLTAGLDAALRRRNRVRAVAGAVTVVVAASLLPQMPFGTVTAEVPRYFQQGGDVERLPAGTVALVAPYPDAQDTSAAMLWQAEAKFRFSMVGALAVVAGPSGRGQFYVDSEMQRVVDAIQSTGVAPVLDGPERHALDDSLRSVAVAVIIVGPMPHRDVAEAFFSDYTGRPPLDDQGVAIWALDA